MIQQPHYCLYSQMKQNNYIEETSALQCSHSIVGNSQDVESAPPISEQMSLKCCGNTRWNPVFKKWHSLGDDPRTFCVVPQNEKERVITRGWEG